MGFLFGLDTVERRSFSVSPSLVNSWATPRPWPNGQIPYCYSDLESKNQIDKIMEASIQRWESSPGGLDGVSFIPFASDTGTICPSEFLSTVVIKHVPDIAWSTIGYRGPNQPHSLLFDPLADWDGNTIGALAHELGHVMGLLHEHERPDAPSYVKLLCSNLFDYASFSQTHSPEQTEQVCTNKKYATEQSFSAATFLPYTNNLGGAFVVQGPFDMDSIMIYNSKTARAAPGLSTLVKLDGDSIERNGFPTAGDALRVRRLYADTKAAT
ncbi:Metallopeptidase, catalytic domain [Lecanosticta acicola]|uniref:Metalloendopeptidase n=1 Tax=Lecanosticta acicola TaxID=111012 RepID=A0AAI8W1J9_9PEZI|nr:Metallopeptidase, catalytic domain [Lecanosticta acicola]